MYEDSSILPPELSAEIEFNHLRKNEYILSNVLHQHYLKINKDTYDILLLIDGKRDLKAICKSYNELYNKSISIEDVETLLYKKLIQYGILKGFENKIKEYRKPSYLKLSFIVINEKVLSRIVPNFYFLFKRSVAIPLITLSLIIIITLLFLNISLYKSFNLQDSLIYFFVVMSISLIFHEIGHATSTSYFGAKHGGIGVGFYLLSPVYFADVTDIWRLKKRQRIIVNFSGIYFELIFCSFLAVVGFLTDNYIFVIITIAVFIHTLFNLNPFLRGDGYWILSDLMAKPNLYHHAIEKVKDLFRLFKGKRPIWNKVDLVLFIYGLANTFFIGLFLYYVLIKNPNSIILFPQNLMDFLKNVFDSNSKISLEKYGELILPMFFFFLLFGTIKSLVQKGLKQRAWRRKPK